MNKRARIQETVFEHPGLHFRELQRRLHLGTGSLTYYLEKLQKGVLKSERIGGYLRFYQMNLGRDYVRYLGALRVESFRRIILFLLAQPGMNHSKITKGVGLAPSTVSSHLMKLQGLDILRQNALCGEKVYVVTEPEKVAQILIEYKESFPDRLVDRFCKMWGI